ncbi:hypothetical protein GYMLUDRAFT_37977 [Collybiopsis luxurians FD-317 M1]|nr:hypothetical protein GYMLUDRAFT_37977 [Collybiopsis luxurians FD-317 M1]
MDNSSLKFTTPKPSCLNAAGFTQAQSWSLASTFQHPDLPNLHDDSVPSYTRKLDLPNLHNHQQANSDIQIPAPALASSSTQRSDLPFHSRLTSLLTMPHSTLTLPPIPIADNQLIHRIVQILPKIIICPCSNPL